MKLHLRKLLNFAVNKAAKTDELIRWGLRHGMYAYEAKTPYDYAAKMGDYQMMNIADKITQDMLIVGASRDHFIDYTTVGKEIAASKNVHSLTFRLFTEAEDACNHCNCGNVKLTFEYLYELDRANERSERIMTEAEYKAKSLKEFDALAAKFDDNDPSIYNICRKDYPAVLAEVEKEPFTSLLDAGCGTGAMLQLLCADIPGKQYAGIDLSEKMIEVANQKNLNGVKFVSGDCEALPFDENSFDVVTCSMSFHHYPNPQKFFAGLNRVLRPGGRFILRDMATNNKGFMWFANHIWIPLANRFMVKGDVHAYTRQDIQTLCDGSGLTLESYEIRKGFRLHCVVRKAG